MKRIKFIQKGLITGVSSVAVGTAPFAASRLPFDYLSGQPF